MAFKRFSVEQHADFLANFLPDGRFLRGKFASVQFIFPEGSLFPLDLPHSFPLIEEFPKDTVLRKYLRGKAPEFKRINDLFITFLDELDPRSTTEFIEEWESAIKIPDSCIPLASTIEERRENVVLKLTSLSIQTEDDFRSLAEVLGFTITFQSDQFLPYDLPHSFEIAQPINVFLPVDLPFSFIGDTSSKFVFVITGNFGIDDAKAEIFNCLVKSLAPSTYRVVLFYTS